MDNFIKKKTIQETWGPQASSTPSIKTAESKNQDLVTPVIDKVASETVIDNDLDEPDVDKTNSTETGWNDEDFKRFEMLLDEKFSKLPSIKDFVPKGTYNQTENDEEKNSHDDFEAAKVWAMNQKISTTKINQQ